MTRLLVNDRWYEPLSRTALYESDFEQLVQDRANLLFPKYHLIPFKSVVYTDEGSSAKADFALIEKTYREWWVVEFELGHHHFAGHIMPQVATLARAVYGSKQAEYLRTKSWDLDSRRLEDMMKGIQPRVFVIVNEPKSDWIEPLRKYEAILGVIEVYRSDRNDVVFQVSGEYPEPRVSVVSDCRVHPVVKPFLEIDAPAGLNVQSGEPIIIRYGDKVTEWKRTDIRDTVFLSFLGRDNPLQRNTPYVLLRTEDGLLEIRRSARK